MTDKPKHLTVYHEPGMYAGWPANQGIWSWGDEILVGFVLGRTARASEKGRWRFGHQIDTTSLMRHTFARSLDGGETWGIEDGLRKGRCGRAYDHTFDCIALSLSELEKAVDFTEDGFALSFVRETNHVGPTHFYLSRDHGESWRGPYEFPDLGLPGVASRTDYIVLGERELIAMLTVAKENGREGRVLCVQTGDGGMTWERLGWVEETDWDGFAIMPSTVRLDSGRLVSAVRLKDRYGTGLPRHYVRLYESDDSGKTWEGLDDDFMEICHLTGHSGGPAKLLKLADGRLLLVYVFRNRMQSGPSRLCCKVSEDYGASWGDEIVLRCDGYGWDLGYPVAVQRPDESVVAVYYWTDRERFPDRYIGATIWKP